MPVPSAYRAPRYFKEAAEHAAAENMAQLAVDFGHCALWPPQRIQKLKGRLDFHLYHLVHKMLIGRTLRTAENELEDIIVRRIGIEVVHYPVQAVLRFYAHMGRLNRI